MVINRAKFDVCAPGSFGGVKTDRHTARITLYTLNVPSCLSTHNVALSLRYSENPRLTKEV